jgi:hypothetical protein
MSLTTPDPEDIHTGFSYREISKGYALINIAFIDIATGNHFTAGKTLNLARSLFKGHTSHFGLVACDITLGDLRCKILMREFADVCQLYLQPFTFLPFAELQTMCVQKLSDMALMQREVTPAQRYATLCWRWHPRVDAERTYTAFCDARGLSSSRGATKHSALMIFDVAPAGFTLLDINHARGEYLIRIGGIQRVGIRRGSYFPGSSPSSIREVRNTRASNAINAWVSRRRHFFYNFSMRVVSPHVSKSLIKLRFFRNPLPMAPFHFMDIFQSPFRTFNFRLLRSSQHVFSPRAGTPSLLRGIIHN